MSQAISFLSILFALLAALTPLLPAFLPFLGLMPIFRMRQIRAVLILTAWALAITALLSPQPSYFAVPFVIFFSILTILVEPQRIFLSLDDPYHIPASLADIPDQALVLAYEDDQRAAAWMYEVLIPRHLINDQVGVVPLLVAY